MEIVEKSRYTKTILLINTNLKHTVAVKVDPNENGESLKLVAVLVDTPVWGDGSLVGYAEHVCLAS